MGKIKVKKSNIIVSIIAAIALSLGTGSIADAQTKLGGHVIDHNIKAKPKAKTYTQKEIYQCAGAVQQANEYINGGDHSKAQKRQFNKEMDRCAKIVGGF